ncbi:hypothetical protein [Mycobacterium sp. 236(2023)]|uniref:hypothetical protein n=1 Tax=Mycobacterium sp. 236(2023) TaxID=3038163 RepID=UPI00241584AE|nr:hypothetical protein [Mycobacterium sp. 236(2023)]MDG4663712.1 hypothetical protein [Mycobacterium sp. 236(2023)]
MTDDIHIRPDEVKSSGALIDEKAEEARARIATLYDAGVPARDGNRGFTTGPALVAYVDAMRAEALNAVQRLQDTGREIVATAQDIASTDEKNAEAVSRIATALDVPDG